MKLICPHFKDNRCTSKCLSQVKFILPAVANCATGDYINCPIYIETIKRENKAEPK